MKQRLPFLFAALVILLLVAILNRTEKEARSRVEDDEQVELPSRPAPISPEPSPLIAGVKSVGESPRR